METIGGKDLIPKWIVTVSWYWNDDKVRLHTKKLNNRIYFPNSPVNILSATELAGSMKDDEVTRAPIKVNTIFLFWILGSTKRQYITQKIIFQN